MEAIAMGSVVDNVSSFQLADYSQSSWPSCECKPASAILDNYICNCGNILILSLVLMKLWQHSDITINLNCDRVSKSHVMWKMHKTLILNYNTFIGHSKHKPPRRGQLLYNIIQRTKLVAHPPKASSFLEVLLYHSAVAHSKVIGARTDLL